MSGPAGLEFSWRGVELTEPGTLAEARQILEQGEQTKANVRNRTRGETGTHPGRIRGRNLFPTARAGTRSNLSETISQAWCYCQYRVTRPTWSRPCRTVPLTWPSSDCRLEAAKRSQYIRSSTRRCGSCCRPITRKRASASCRSPHSRRKRLFFLPARFRPVSTTASSQVASVRDLVRC
jgi:hypothetical protein